MVRLLRPQVRYSLSAQTQIQDTPANEFACYYRWAYVNGLEVPDGVYMDIHSLAGTSPAFEKLPARTQNERCGKYLELTKSVLRKHTVEQFTKFLNGREIW